ncbi:MAG: hypothetical protein KDK70_08925 [Myxococcales bacterium]|nr:hypothetical protein [Myxococcales bacterium]
MPLLSLAPLAALALVASLDPPTAEPEDSKAAAASEPAPASEPTTTSEPAPAWLRRWAPERNVIELGLYGGVLLPSRRIELFEADFDLPDQGYKPLAPAIPDFGLRLGYTPLPFFGVEVEGGVMPGRTEAGDRVLLWTGRGSLVGQVGLWSVTPFVLLGGGLLGVSSDRSVLGNDVDASMHFGGGVKVHATRLVQLRLDVRDVIAARRGYNAGVVHDPELLLGVAVTLGRTKPKPTAPARDATSTDTDADANAEADASADDRCPAGSVGQGDCPVSES